MARKLPDEITGLIRGARAPDEESPSPAAAADARHASLIERLATALAPLRRWIEPRTFLASWAAGATLLCVVLLVERHREAPPLAATEMTAPAPAQHASIPAAAAATVPPPGAPVDLAPPLPPGLAGAPPPLAGIVGRLPDDAVALVKTPSGRTRTLAVGAVFDGWTLASLDADEAVFTRRGQRVSVALPIADDQ